MTTSRQLAEFAPLFAADTYTEQERATLAPFFSNLNSSVYAPLIFSPEVIGALCSRTSRAANDLRHIFLNEYITPFINPERSPKDSDEAWQQKQDYGQQLIAFIAFLQQHPIEQIFSNPRARSFYAKWLAQYGDDSIAQMAGMHLAYTSISQLAIKHFEDQRIGLAPIEKSTRYVDFGAKVNGHYRYYTDPTLADCGLHDEYEAAMDGLFDTYLDLKPKIITWLTEQFPEEKPKVIETKALDTLRGLLPMATLSQVAFFGNGQAFEYLIARSLQHRLGEIRWAAEGAYTELFKIAPSFLRRLKATDPEAKATADSYQEYKAGLSDRLAPLTDALPSTTNHTSGPTVQLVEHDPTGEAKILTGLLYGATNNHRSWSELLEHVMSLPEADRRTILEAALSGRTQRWQKVPRAFENTYTRFEITMNIGAWRDLHRHRMLTQQRQYFTCQHGFDTPQELIDAGLAEPFQQAVANAEQVYARIKQVDPDLAQYAVTLAHRVRFMQWENLRESFWEVELRTIPEGHPDYRVIEQEKFRQLARAYPLITEYMHVNMEHYDFARRGQDEKIAAKLKSLEELATT